jgi:hypothetical protein
LMGLLIAFQLLIYAAAVMGALALRNVRVSSDKWGIILILITTLVLLLSPGPDGNERFRVPAQPLLAYLAAYGIAFEILPLIARLRHSKHHEGAKSEAPAVQ